MKPSPPSEFVIFLVLLAAAYPSSVTSTGVEETTTKEDSDIHYVADDSSFNDKASFESGVATDNIKRAYDPNIPDENKTPSSLFKNGENVAFSAAEAAAAGKYMSDDDRIASVAGIGERPNNIQRVPPKSIGIMDSVFERSELYTPFSNVSNSDVQWLTRIFNTLHWDPKNIPGAALIDTRCAALMQRYLKALHNGILWASKSEYRWSGSI